MFLSAGGAVRSFLCTAVGRQAHHAFEEPDNHAQPLLQVAGMLHHGLVSPFHPVVSPTRQAQTIQAPVIEGHLLLVPGNPMLLPQVLILCVLGLRSCGSEYRIKRLQVQISIQGSDLWGGGFCVHAVLWMNGKD